MKSFFFSSFFVNLNFLCKFKIFKSSFERFEVVVTSNFVH